MATAFDYMTDALFNDPNMTHTAMWRLMGVGTPTEIKVLKRSPDEIAEWNSGSFVVGTLLLEIKIADVPDLTEADTIEIDGVPHTIRGVPQRDAEGLTWLVQVRARY